MSELKIRFKLRSREGKRLEVSVEAPGGEAEGECPLPDASLLDEIGRVETGKVPGALVEKVGDALYSALASEKVDELVVDTLNDAMRASQPLQFELRFAADEVDLNRYPWEMIRTPQGQFLVRDGLIDLTRYITYPQPPPTFDSGVTGLPLFRVVSAPSTLPPLDYPPLTFKPVQELKNATFEAFMRVLLIDRVKLWGLQFDGHGTLALQCPHCDTLNAPTEKTCRNCSKSLEGARKIGALAFEQEGGVNWVPTGEFGSVLYNAQVKLALLLACESATVGSDLVFSGLAPGLLLAGVPAVIGMQYPVRDKFVNSFANELYTALAKDGDILGALRIARRMNMLDAWYSPALYLRRQPSAAEEAKKAIYLSRKIDTAAPAKVHVRNAFLVRLWIRRPETKALSAAKLRKELDIPKDVPVRQSKGAAEVKFEPVAGRSLRRGEVDITLTGKNAEITPASMKLFVDEDVDAPPAIFTVRAGEVGTLPLIFSALQDGGVIHSVTHTIEVVGDPNAAAAGDVAEHSEEVAIEKAADTVTGKSAAVGGAAVGMGAGFGGAVPAGPPAAEAPPPPPSPAPAGPGGSVTSAGSAHPMMGTYMDAFRAYEEGKYNLAIELFRKCIDGGLTSPEVYEYLQRSEAEVDKDKDKKAAAPPPPPVSPRPASPPRMAAPDPQPAPSQPFDMEETQRSIERTQPLPQKPQKQDELLDALEEKPEPSRDRREMAPAFDDEDTRVGRGAQQEQAAPPMGGVPPMQAPIARPTEPMPSAKPMAPAPVLATKSAFPWLLVLGGGVVVLAAIGIGLIVLGQFFTPDEIVTPPPPPPTEAPTAVVTELPQITEMPLAPTEAAIPNAPEPPVLLTPEDGTRFTCGDQITLDWADVETPAGISYYGVIVSIVDEGGNIYSAANDTTKTSDFVFQPDCANPGTTTTYIWTAWAVDGNTLTGAAANVRSFFSNTPVVGGGTGWIAFVSGRSGMPDLWIADLSFGETVNLTNGQFALVDHPSWSPKGQIVFSAMLPTTRSLALFSKPQRDLWVINSDGSGLTNLTNSTEVDESQPAWSPDGRYIAYAVGSGLRYIQVMDTSTGELLFAEKLQNSSVEFVQGSDQFSPAWSPDSTMLVFSRGDGRAEADLVLASLDGSAAQILTELPGMETGASWSVNNLIAFTYIDPATGESDLYTVTSKGSNLTLLSGLKGYEYGAAWSPDGLILLFGYGQDSRQIIRLNFNDGSTSSVFKESSQDFDPAWQP